MATNIFQLMRPEFEKLAQAVVEKMRAMGPESKTSPDDGAYAVLKDPWEEYALQIQEEESYLFGAYRHQIALFCQQEVEELSFHELTQLWCATSESISYSNDFLSRDEMIEPVSKEVFAAVDELANNEAEIAHYWAERRRLEEEEEAEQEEFEERQLAERQAREAENAATPDSPAAQLPLF